MKSSEEIKEWAEKRIEMLEEEDKYVSADYQHDNCLIENILMDLIEFITSE